MYNLLQYYLFVHNSTDSMVQFDEMLDFCENKVVLI